MDKNKIKIKAPMIPAIIGITGKESSVAPLKKK